jgi:hypothetical protein
VGKILPLRNDGRAVTNIEIPVSIAITRKAFMSTKKRRNGFFAGGIELR